MYTAAYNRSPVTEDSEQTNKVDTVCDALRKALLQEDENKWDMISQEVLQFKDTFTFYMLSYQKDWSPQNSFMYWYLINFREDLSQSAYKF